MYEIGVEPEKAQRVKKTVRWTVFSDECEEVYDRADSMQGEAAADDDPCYPHQTKRTPYWVSFFVLI